MDMQVAGKRAFVSGSTQGIGFAIAKALLAEGAEVIINGRDQVRVDRAVALLQAAMPEARVFGIAADFADAAQVSELCDQLGPVDILVNNVGIFGLATFGEITDEDWLHYFIVNVLSGVRLARAVLPGMLAAGRGRILFISSESGVNVPGDMTHYGVSKAGMIALANGLAKLTAGTEVTVNTILGGPTYSDGVAHSVEEIARAQGIAPDQLKSAIASGNRTSLLGRFIVPAEIAALAVYLASPLSSATNGAALRADGGVLTAML